MRILEIKMTNNQKKTRKRHKHSSRAQKRKQQRNAGLEYISSTGKKMPGKEFLQAFDCKCRKKCVKKVAEIERRTIFDLFWKMNSFSEQNVFLCGLIRQRLPAYRRPRNSTRRAKEVTNSFRFQVGAKSVTVCKSFFLKTLQISDGRMTRALRKIRDGQQPGSDGRGRHVPKNKTSEEAMKVVREHIESFPCYQSHYTRTENPNRKFLSPDMNVRKMYDLYKEMCSQNNINLVVSEVIYRRRLIMNLTCIFTAL